MEVLFPDHLQGPCTWSLFLGGNGLVSIKMHICLGVIYPSARKRGQWGMRDDRATWAEGKAASSERGTL